MQQMLPQIEQREYQPKVPSPTDSVSSLLFTNLRKLSYQRTKSRAINLRYGSGTGFYVVC